LGLGCRIHRDNHSNTGEITLGSTNKKRFNGDLVYVPLEYNGRWIIRINGIKIGDKTVAGNITVGMDTGCSAIYGNEKDIQLINDFIGAIVPEIKAQDDGTNKRFYLFACSIDFDSLPPVYIGLGNKWFTIYSSDYVVKSDNNTKCFSRFVSHGDVYSVFWVFGQGVFHRLYTVFGTTPVLLVGKSYKFQMKHLGMLIVIEFLLKGKGFTEEEC
ncbi:unnamed protein product, partial [Didymodactylos carnosus]